MLNPKELVAETAQEALEQLRAFGKFCLKRRLLLLGSFAAVCSTTIGLLSYDHTVLEYMETHQSDAGMSLAFWSRRWGDFIGTVIIAALLLSLGWMLNIRQWRRIAVAVFLGSAMAGIFVNIFRFTTGRVRPHKIYEEHRDFVGPTFRYSYQSFPSGHTGAAFGQSTTLLVAMPVLGVPTTVASGMIGWASIYSARHWATDVWAGMWAGVVIGGAFGMEVRRRCKADKPAQTNPQA